MKISIPPMTRVKEYGAAMLASLMLLGASGCHYTSVNVVRKHYCLAPSLYHHCPKCGKFTAKGLPHCCESNAQPAFSGYQATCWRAWPSEWERCPAPNAAACEAPQETVPLDVPPPMSVQPLAPVHSPMPTAAPPRAPMPLTAPETNNPEPAEQAPEVKAPEVKAPEVKTPEVKAPVEEKPSVLEKKVPIEEPALPAPPTVNDNVPAPVIPRTSLVPPPSFEQPTFVEPTYVPAPTYTPSPTYSPATNDEYNPALNQPSPSDLNANPYETTHKPVTAPHPSLSEPTPAAPLALQNSHGSRNAEYQAKREPKKSVLVAPPKKLQPALTPTAVEPAAPPAIRRTMELPTPTKTSEAKVTLPNAVLPIGTPKKTTASLPNAAPQAPTFKTSVLNAAKVMEAPRNATPIVEEPELKPITPAAKPAASEVKTENFAPIVVPAKTARPNKIPALEAKLSTLTTSSVPANPAKLAAAHVEIVEPVQSDK